MKSPGAFFSNSRQMNTAFRWFLDSSRSICIIFGRERNLHAVYTLQDTIVYQNQEKSRYYPPGSKEMSHLGKRNMIFKSAFSGGDMFFPMRVFSTNLKLRPFDTQCLRLASSHQLLLWLLCLIWRPCGCPKRVAEKGHHFGESDKESAFLSWNVGRYSLDTWLNG